MKFRSKPIRLGRALSLLAAIAVVLPLHAQTQSLAGFVFVNATGLEKPVKLFVDGRSMSDDGYEACAATSGLGFPEGSHRIQITGDRCEPAAFELHIQKGACPTVVVIRDKISAPQPGKPEFKFRFKVIPSAAQSEKYLARIVYMPALIDGKPPGTALHGTVGKTAVNLAPFQPVEVETTRRTSLQLENNPDPLDKFEFSDKGTCLYIVFPMEDGQFRAATSEDRIYSWD